MVLCQVVSAVFILEYTIIYLKILIFYNILPPTFAFPQGSPLFFHIAK